MPKVERFEDLLCWQKARELVKIIYTMTKEDSFFRDYRFKEQLQSASVSVMSNIAEGFSRFHRKEFIRFLDFSQSSASEVKSLLYVAIDQNYLPSDQITHIQQIVDDTRQLVLGLLRYLKSNIKDSQDGVRETLSHYDAKESTELILPEKFLK